VEIVERLSAGWVDKMALKDWKKITRVYPYWINNKTDNRVQIHKTLQIREEYYVQYGYYPIPEGRRFFMTKRDALKFAKLYMSGH